jgi:hypothetical protein
MNVVRLELGNVCRVRKGYRFVTTRSHAFHAPALNVKNRSSIIDRRCIDEYLLLSWATERFGTPITLVCSKSVDETSVDIMNGQSTGFHGKV